MKRIRSRVIASILICSLLATLIIGLFSLLESSQIITNERMDRFQHMAQGYAAQFSIVLHSAERTVDTLIPTIESVLDADAFLSDRSIRANTMASIHPIIQKAGEGIEGIHGIYFIINPELTGEIYQSWYIKTPEGPFVFHSLHDPDLFDPTSPDMAWYYLPLQQTDGVWIPPYTDPTVNVHMITYARAVYANDQPIGVIGIDLHFEQIEATVENMQVYDTGYAFLLDEEFNTLLHPHAPMGTSPLDIGLEDVTTVLSQLRQNDSGTIEYRYRGEDKVMGYSHLCNGWVFSITSEADEIFAPIQQLRGHILMIMGSILVIASLVGYFISKSITDPIHQLRDLAEQISAGKHDISIELNATTEINEMAQSLNTMTRKLVQSHHNLKDMRDEMEYMAYHDALTDLPNRRFGKAKLDEVIKDTQRSPFLTGIMFIDLDDFKSVNDTYGHDLGDEVLIISAQRMRECIRDHDIVFRLSGDEFMIIFRQISGEFHLNQLAYRLLDTMVQPMHVGDYDIHVSCSIGIAIVGKHGTDAATIMRCADKALYQAKEAGKQTYRVFMDDEPS